MPTSPRKGSLAVLFLTVFVDLLGFGIVIPLLPIYGKYFTGGEAARGWIVGLLMASFSAMQFLFAPIWGRVSDRVGRRPILMLGLLGSAVFYTLFGLATEWESLTWLFVSRIGAGICGATISTAQAYIADTTALQDRSKGMALIGAAFGLGFTFGPLFGAFAFPKGVETPTALPGYLAAGLSAFAFLLAVFKLPESLVGRSGAASHGVGRSATPSYHAMHTWLDLAALRQAIATPSVGLLVLASFICVFSFGNLETTLSILLKGRTDTSAEPVGPFQLPFREIFLTYGFIGLVLLVVQGAIVRRLASRLPESSMALTGAVMEVIGFLLMIQAIGGESLVTVYIALGLLGSGFAMMTPAINSLISRRSHPAWQGGILGVAQSANSLARILAPLAGLPLLHRGVTLPYWLAAALMAAGGLLVFTAARRGKDYGTTSMTREEFAGSAAAEKSTIS